MSFIICERETLQGLVNFDDAKGNSGGNRNPASQPIAFMSSAYGPWSPQSNRGNSHKAMTRMVTSAHGAAPAQSMFLYQSQPLSSDEADIDFLQSTIEKYAGRSDFVDFVQWPAFITMNDQRYGTDVPSYMPNFQTADVDGDGNPTGTFTPVKWRDWKDATHNHFNGDNVNIILTNANTGGFDLAGTILVMLLNDAAPFDVQPIKDLPDVQALVITR